MVLEGEAEGPGTEPRGPRSVTGRLRRTLRSLPPLTRLGVLVLMAGAALDLGGHLLGGPSLAARCCGPAFVGHLVTLAGMILAVAGVLTLAFRRRSRPARPREGRS